MSDEQLREKYKAITGIIGETLEKDSGFLFHIWATKFCADYYKDFKVLGLHGNPIKAFWRETVGWMRRLIKNE